MTFEFLYMNVNKIRLLGKFFGIILLVSLSAYVLINNFSPFGVTSEYSLTDIKNPLVLGPKNRVTTKNINGQNAFVQTNDLVYFLTSMSFNFDSATVRITFQNPDPEQTISLGFQDQDTWHYATQLIDAPLLNSLTWEKIGKNPTLYQRNPKFTSVDKFLLSPPKDSLIGTYAYDTDLAKSDLVTIPGYSASTSESNSAAANMDTVINTPLRGRHVMYVYLHNEPFIMTIKKQDLNWYPDPDVMNINVYKDNNLVHSSQIDDDGITDASKKVLPPQEVTIKNSGPGLPENGVYKIILDANSDTVISQIKTNLHKIVFQGSIFPANNSDSYPGLTKAKSESNSAAADLEASSSGTILFTNALTLSALTYHNSGKQKITIGDSILDVNALKTEAVMAPKDTLSKVVIPKNDVILKAFQGFFAFSPDEFFVPLQYHVIPITGKDDIDLSDYILTNYTPSKESGDSRIAEYTFNLFPANIKNGKLSWIIKSPGLVDNNRQIIIKNIEVTLKKKGFL